MRTASLITAVLAIAPMLASTQAGQAQQPLKHVYATADARALRAPHIPEAWQEQDPAVALYKQGRTQLNGGNYKRAAQIFGEIVRKYPRSTYTPDAYYWQAFALYKAGDNTEARAVLAAQQKSYPKAATARDGATLLAQINSRLAQAGDAGAAQVVTNLATTSVQGCPSDDDEDDVRIIALNSVLTMNSQQAVPLLKQILARRDACSAALRRKAVFLLSQKRSPEVEDMLLSAARNDPDKEVRSQAVFWLSQVNTERSVGYLEEILKSSSDVEVQEKAIFALSQHRDEHAARILRGYAENASAPADLREKAVFWIGQRHGPDNAAFLKTLYGREKNLDLKDKILFALSQQRGNESWLMDIAMNENENIEMRKKALFWAGQSRNTALAELAGLYDRIQNREMKDQLIFVYSQRREPQAVDKMMAIARSEPDRELRKKAIFWLSQSKDPRVAEFLMQLINQ